MKRTLILWALLILFFYTSCSESKSNSYDPGNNDKNTHAPVINGLTYSPKTVQAGNNVTITANASDPDGNSLNYEWDLVYKPQGSSVYSMESFNRCVLNPNSDGNYKVKCIVSDGKFSVSQEIIIPVGENPNNVPRIDELLSTPLKVYPGDKIMITAVASDDESTVLTYSWKFLSKPADSLSGLTESENTVTFNADTFGKYEVECIVSDGINEVAKTIIINIEEDTYGSLKRSYGTAGYVYDSIISGNYLYAACGSGGIKIYDITDIENPVFKNSYESFKKFYSFFISGNYLFAADSWGLNILDISNPLEPEQIEAVNIPYASGKKVRIIGNYAYLAAGEGGLQIIDISDPAVPEITGKYYSEDARGLAISGNFAYIADYDDGLKIVDISNPSSPKLVSEFDPGSNVMDINVTGNYAYLACHMGDLKIVDITNPSEPVLAGSCLFAGYAYGIFITDNVAYIAADNAGLQIVDITTPASPQLIGNVDTDGYAVNVNVSGNHAFIADQSGGLKIIDISALTMPVLKQSLVSYENANNIFVLDDLAIMSYGSAGIKIIDITDPSQPVIKGSLDTSEALDAVVSGSYAYVADGSAGLKIINISDTSSLQLEGSIDTYDAQSVFVSGETAYIADGREGLKIINIADHSDPDLITSYTIDGFTNKVHVVGNYAYVTNSSSGENRLIIINVSDPDSPVETAILNTNTSYMDNIYVSGNYVYLLDTQLYTISGYGTLHIIDISTPTAPVLAGSIETLGNANSIFVSKDTAYIADGTRGLTIFNISDPSAPNHIITIETDNARALYGSGDFIYIAEGTSLDFLKVFKVK